MKKITGVKKKFFLWGVILAISLTVLIAAFSVHCYHVNRYNAATRVIASSDTDGSGVCVDIHPRGQSTDSWDKADDVLGETLRGIIYEVTVTNGSSDSMTDWSLDIDFSEKAYVNNAWCGTVEVHQNLADGERTQTVDLRNCDRDALTLDYHITGNDVMLTLTPGSSLIYHPSTADKEIPLDSGSTVNAGIIFYTYGDSVDLSDFTFTYKLHRAYLGEDAHHYVAGFTVWAIFLFAFILMLIVSAQYEKRLQESDRLMRESLDVFTNFVDAKDPYTKGHSKRVAEYSRMIAERLGLPEDRCKQIYYIAMLHDIGKCYVPDEILKKPSRLTDEEFDVIKTHTTHGAEMVKNFSSIPGIREGALYHHERYDGRGYPTGIKGEDIPLIARIICVADSYDAMNSDRVYREKLPRDVIISELERGRGTQFDPKLVDIFLEILKDLPQD